MKCNDILKIFSDADFAYKKKPHSYRNAIAFQLFLKEKEWYQFFVYEKFFSVFSSERECLSRQQNYNDINDIFEYISSLKSKNNNAQIQSSYQETKEEKDMIYSNQENCAKEIINLFFPKNGSEPRKSVLLRTGPQEGKTGVMISLRKQIKDAVFLIINHIGSSSLKEQTRERFEKHGFFKPEVYVLHTSSFQGQGNEFGKEAEEFLEYYRNFLNSLKENNSSNKNVIILLDECHWALDKDGGPMTFLSKLSVSYGEENFDIPDWIRILSVSATPFPHLVAENATQFPSVNSKFSHVSLERSENYLSIEKLHKNNRIQSSDKGFQTSKKNLKVSPLLKDALADFSITCQEEGPKYAIIRILTGLEQNIFKDEILKNPKFKNWSIEQFQCRTDNDVNTLVKKLKEKPLHPSICLIKQAFNAGMTINTKHIGMWWEPTSDLDPARAQLDTLAQRIGRACGYNKKSDFQYPIYCNKQYYSTIRDYYLNQVNFIPCGTYTTNIQKNQYEWKPISKNEHKNKTGSSIKRHYISGTTSHDLCELILNNHSLNEVDKEVIIVCDGPCLTSDKFDGKLSFQKLLNERPEFKNSDAKLFIKKSIVSQHSKNSILND